MKALIFAFVALPILAICQAEQDKTVFFAADTVEIDSFYILQTTFVPNAGRIDTFKQFEFFRDTQSLKNYRDNLRQHVDALLQRIMFLRVEYDSLNSRLLELDTLVSQIIQFVGGEIRPFVKVTEHEIPFQQFDIVFMSKKRNRKRRKNHWRFMDG